MPIDQEQIDRAIDMVEKVKGLAEKKGFDFKKLVQKHGASLKTIPNVKIIKANPEEHVPLIEAEMRSILAIISTK